MIGIDNPIFGDHPKDYKRAVSCTGELYMMVIGNPKGLPCWPVDVEQLGK